MSQSVMVPVTGQGTIVDPSLGVYLPELMVAPFNFTDVFFYSHGWWTTAQAAMVDYSRFSVGMLGQILRLATAGGLAAPSSSLEVGVHWPAMISEDSESVISVLQPLTFFNRAAMADDVGEHGGQSVLRLMLEALASSNHAGINFHLIGHSFGARVVSAALAELVKQVPASSLARHRFNLVLLQGALDSNAFEAGNAYGAIFGAGGVPHLRTLITRSSEDTAVGTWYPDAYKLQHLFRKSVTGIGATGPSPGTPGAAAALSLPIGPGFTIPPPPSLKANSMVVADLTTLHRDNTVKGDSYSGHHSDIYREEIYRLIAGFLF